MRKLVTETAEALGCTAELEYCRLEPSVRNEDLALNEIARDSARKLYGGEVLRDTVPATGSEDFSYIAQKVPAFFCWVGAGQPGSVPLHNPNVILDERALEYGVKTMASLPFFWAGEPDT